MAEERGLFNELGQVGYEVLGGGLELAYTRELRWPDVEPIYSRLWRSDPETVLVRAFLSAAASGVRLSWVSPKNPNAADMEALAFAESLDADIPGGIAGWLRECMERVTFFGWGFWETPLCLRKKNWAPPGGGKQGRGWASRYDDGLIGIRRIAWRDYSSFDGWEFDEESGDATGFRQVVAGKDAQTIPLDRGVHVTWGDSTNPEGLPMLEALYRLEAYKRRLEMVMGIGFERSAGYVKFTVKEKPNETDKAFIRQAARSLLSAQEGNYLTDIEGRFTAAVIDSPFGAAPNIMEAIRYYGILKLALFGMQFVAMSSLSGAGSYAALNDASSMAILLANTTKDALVAQFNDQVVTRLFSIPTNAKRFGGMQSPPQLVATDLAKTTNLPELAAFVQAIGAILPLYPEDIAAIRERSGLLPVDPDTSATPVAAPAPAPDGPLTAPTGKLADLAHPRMVAIPADELPTDISGEAEITDSDIAEAWRRFEKWQAEKESKRE